MVKKLQRVCCWQILNNAWTAHFDVPDTELAGADNSVVQAFVKSPEQILLNGMGVWARTGIHEYSWLARDSLLYRILAVLSFKVTDAKFSCNKCSASWGLYFCSNGLGLESIIAEFLKESQCNCSSFMTEYLDADIGECCVCLGDDLHLVKLAGCIHTCCTECAPRLTRCPQCRLHTCGAQCTVIRTGIQRSPRTVVSELDAVKRLCSTDASINYQALYEVLYLREKNGDTFSA